MMSIFTIDDSFASNIVFVLAHSVWIGMAIGVFTWIANLAMRNQTANARYWLNLMALAAFTAMLPASYFWLADIEPTANRALEKVERTFVEPQTRVAAGRRMEGKSTTGDFNSAPPTLNPVEIDDQDNVSGLWFAFEFPEWLKRGIAVSYMLGVCYMCFRLMLAVRRSQKVLRSAEEIVEPTLLKKAEQVSRSLSSRLKPMLATSQDIVVPVAIGILRPAILLPTSILTGLTAIEIEYVLRHEIAHLRRHDHVVIVVQRLLESILFFHPVAWYLSRRICEEREHCCDDLACSAGVNRIQYANVLLKVAELTCVGKVSGQDHRSPVAMAADGNCPSKLRRRISRLLIGNSGLPATGHRVMLCFATMLSLSAVLVAGHVLTDDLDSSESPPSVESNLDDVPPELLELLKASTDSFASIQTGHVKFKSYNRGVDNGLDQSQCALLVKDIHSIDSVESFSELVGQLSKQDGMKTSSLGSVELHFDQDRTREATGRLGGIDLHISTPDHDLRWDSANYQMNVYGAGKSPYFHFTDRHFLRPLLPPQGDRFLDASLQALFSSKVSRSEQGYLIQSGPDQGAKDQMLISKNSGFPRFRKSVRQDRVTLRYWSGWTSYSDEIWFPQVVLELRFKNDKLKYFSAQFVESARFNIELEDRLFVMSAPAGTTLIRNGQYAARLNEDVFDVLSESEIIEASKRRAERELTPEEKRGANAARELYRLKEGEVVKRLGPPYSLAQKYVPQMFGNVPDGLRPQTVISRIIQDNKGELSQRHMCNGSSYKVRDVVEQIFGLHLSAIEGPPEMLAREIPGDFVVQKGADRAKVVEDFERILNTAFDSEVEVKFAQVDRPLYVANGVFKLNPAATKEVRLHGGSRPNAYPEVIQSGDVKGFLSSLSEYIKRSVVVGDLKSHEQEFRWSTAIYQTANPDRKKFDFQVEKVLDIVSEQTGMKFEKQSVKKAVLMIQQN